MWPLLAWNLQRKKGLRKPFALARVKKKGWHSFCCNQLSKWSWKNNRVRCTVPLLLSGTLAISHVYVHMYIHMAKKTLYCQWDNKWNRYTEHKKIFSSNLNTTDIPSSIWHWRYSHRCLTAQTIQERGWWQSKTVWHRFHRAVFKNVLPWLSAPWSGCENSLWSVWSIHQTVPQVFPSCYREFASNLCTSAHHIGSLPALFWKLRHWNWYLLLLFWKSYWNKFPLHLVTWLLLDSDFLSPHFWWLFHKDEIWPHPCSKSFYIERHSQSVHSNVSQHFILWQNSVLDFSASLCSICDDIPVMVLKVQRE